MGSSRPATREGAQEAAQPRSWWRRMFGDSVDWWSVLEVAVGVVAGGAIATYFARKASAELRAEAVRLHLIVTVLALHMERDGVLKGVVRDERGLIKGVPPFVEPLPGEEPEEGFAPGGDREGAQRPWWRRVFGG